MEKLTIKELAPYLPYGLKVMSKKGTVYELDVYYNMRGDGIEKRDLNSVLDNGMKPLLRNLSQLTEEIEHNGEGFVPVDVLGWNSYENIIKKGICDSVGYQYMIKLFEWHFDVFGLIDRGLALSIDGKEVEGE